MNAGNNSLSCICTTVATLMIPVFCHAQEVITLHEITRNNKMLQENPSDHAFPVADINSTFKITLNKDSIQTLAAQLVGFQFAIPKEKIDRINKLLIKEQEVLSFLKFDENDSVAHRKKILSDFSKAMGEFLDILIKTYPRGTEERAQLNDILSQADLSMYEQIYTFIRTQMQEIDQAMQQALDSGKVYFRLGGWLKNKYGSHPVHIPEFDLYADEQFFEVPAFVTAVPTEELDRFQKLQDLSKDINSDNKSLLTAFRDEIKENTNALIDFLDNKIIANLKSIQDAVPPDNMTRAISDSIKEITEAVMNLRTALDHLQQAAADSATFTFSIALNTAFQQVGNQITPAVTAIQHQKDSLVNRLKAIGVDAGALKENLDDAEDRLRQLQNELSPLVEALGNLPNEAAQKPKANALIFGEDVLKLALTNLPDFTYLDLRTTGFRENDDELYLKATLGRQALSSANEKEKVIYFTRVSLFQVLMYSAAKAVLLFTDKINASFINDKQFQINPSYSILFKWGMRESLFYNRYISPGIGLNISTLDFDNDGTPEVGLGLVGSVFNDYVQIGLGKDLTEGSNYWFFGIRLPLLGIDFGGSQQTDVQVKD